MSDSEVAAKATLQRYLVSVREALLWKLDGLSAYDRRRPMTPTGTNLLGLVKHVAYVAAGYLGDCFDRPFGEPYPWDEGDEADNLDMWVPAEESTEQILALYARVWEHADATIEALDLDSPGVVPWWSGDRKHVTLHQILIHVIAEINRHTGHADIIREQIDEAVGLREGVSNLPDHDADWWRGYVARIEAAAEAAQATEV